MTPARQGTRGRFPHLFLFPPPARCEALVVQERKHNRVSPLTPSGVERTTLPGRQHTRRLGCKGNACSKASDAREHQFLLAFASSHFVVPHRC